MRYLPVKKHNQIITSLLAVFFLLLACQENPPSTNSGKIHTVNGPITGNEMKVTLTHEHFMSNFGADMSEASEYDERALFDQVIPYAEKVKSLGIHTVFDATTAHFGRRVDILKRIADSTGLQIVTNTGFYGAANDRYVPGFAYDATAGEIAEVWIKEFKEGINGTGIKPGFVKLAFDEGPPSEIDLKLFEAGILTHLATGLTLAVHTGDNTEAVNAQLRLLEQYGVCPGAWVWVHAHWTEDVDYLVQTAAKGAWISLDGANSSNIPEFINILNRFKSENLLHRVLLSHDGDAFPLGGDIRPFEAIPRSLIPAMRENGFTEVEIEQIMVENPGEAFLIRVREH